MRKSIKQLSTILIAAVVLSVTLLPAKALAAQEPMTSVAPVEYHERLTAYGTAPQKESNDALEAANQKTVRYFKDVSTKTKDYKKIEWLTKKGMMKGIAKKGGKFYPNRNLTQQEAVKMLKNLYGSRIKLTAKNPKAVVTQQWATQTLTSVSKQLGHRVRWSGGAPAGKVSRGKFCSYVYRMIKSVPGTLNP